MIPLCSNSWLFDLVVIRAASLTIIQPKWVALNRAKTVFIALRYAIPGGNYKTIFKFELDSC